MLLLTIFLAVLILGLVFGNILLYFTRPANKWENFHEKREEPILKNSGLELVAKEVIADKKAEMAHRRIDEMERALRSKGNAPKNLPDYDSKLQELEKFRSNTEVEMRAMKEILLEMKAKGAGKSKNPGRLSDEELHNLVFRSN
jgi:hypothetical protein